MSEKNLTISPDAPLKSVLDYEALRKLGMQYIEQLGNTYWTDYNTHDPGITILEVLAYALSELGYRMQFPIRDLLTAEPGDTQPQDTRFTARQILTTNPVTTPDYRKLLIDLNGVANAWLAKVDDWQPDVYADCETKHLSFDKTEYKLAVRGIWDVLLELESSDEFGNLNASSFDFEIPEGTLKGNTIAFVCYQRPDVSWSRWAFSSLTKVEINKWEKETNTRWNAVLTYTFKEGGETTDVELACSVYAKGWQAENPDQALKNVLKKTTEGSLQAAFLSRLQAILGILQTVEATLHDNRNLCEDFRKVSLVSTEEISFCADIETTPEADLEEVEARIILAIEEYLTPQVPFHSLRELLENGTPTDKIFNGPQLQHGFIMDDELAASGLRTNVYTSDIINLLMDIDGVKTVSNFVMSKWNAVGQLVKKAEKWALSITPNHKPAYSLSRSKWTFYKNRIPFATRNSEVEDIYNLLKAESQRGKLVNRQLDVELPDGKSRELHAYFTIQNDFPLAYAIGDEGLPANATKERKNQAKQLQGYLQFYDQILANFLAQIEHFKQYISLEESVDQTYYHHFLSSLPGTDYLYKDATALEAALPLLAEDSDMFLERRNRILDHLLARFQETFNNYVLMLYSASGEQKAGTELILDKINFLKNYPEMSRRRFTALNIKAANTWPYTSSAGLKQRISRLGGINNSEEEFLMPIRLRLKLDGVPADDKWIVSWHPREGGTAILKAKESVEGMANAKRSARKAFQRFVEGSGEAKKAGSKYRFVVGKDEYLYQSTSLFESAESALAFADELRTSLEMAEGLNLLEHILLRPYSKDYRLMDACIPENCTFCGDEDPYSFKLSIILPYWPSRFRIMHYRRHIEELVHTETPAHLLPKVCWADPFAWQEFEDAWQAWLAARSTNDSELHKLTTARMIAALEDVETVYPEAVLHDCEDDKDENPVILNQTKLGIF